MLYTVWQAERLLGETDLDYEPLRPGHRGGTFFPSAGSEALIPTADLSLQLRDSRGRVVPTDWVAVYDLETSADWLEMDELDELDELVDESAGEEFSRYQIQLMLADGATIP